MPRKPITADKIKTEAHIERFFNTAKPASIPPEQVAEVIGRFPQSAPAKTFRRWGDDDRKFYELMNLDDPEAVVWRTAMGQFLATIKPDTSGRTLYRGWKFGSKDDLASFLKKELADGVFTNTRPGMSSTYSTEVATRGKFLSGHAMIWEIRSPKTARDFEEILKVAGAKYPDEREAIFPEGARLRQVGPPRKRNIIRNGQKIRYLHYVFEEMEP